MKKTIAAVMIAVSTVLSAQATATNTAQVTILGEVSDASNSCVVTSTGTLNNDIAQLITATTTGANAEAAGKLFKTQDFGFEVKNCAQDSTNLVISIAVNASGTSSNDATTLGNAAANGVADIGIGIQRVNDVHCVAFDSSNVMSESYSATSGTQLRYTTGHVKTNAAAPATEGPVRGVATFTIDYTN